MNKEETVDHLTQKMMEFDRGEPELIQHFIKVHAFARMICRAEKVDAYTQFITECAALVHDIGTRPAVDQYGYSDGKLQEELGPGYARNLLEDEKLNEEDIERVCYLVGHHHTYDNIQGMDYQILVEADFLTNFYDNATDGGKIQRIMDKVFKTSTGRKLCETIFRPDSME